MKKICAIFRKEKYITISILHIAVDMIELLSDVTNIL